MSDALDSTDPKLLARMLDRDPGGSRVWRPEELGSILTYEMQKPVQFDLASLPEISGRRLGKLSASEGLLLNSLENLLFHPHPPLELLVALKDFAKANRKHPDAALPRQIASLLYVASIVVAMVRRGRRITTQPDASLRKSIEWSMERSWVNEKMRALFQEGLDLLDSSFSDTDG